MIEGIVLFGIFLVLVLLGVPVAFAFGTAALVIVVFVLDLPLVILAQRAGTAVDSFALLAIPLFLFAGGLMHSGGIMTRLIRFTNDILGWITGGLALANVGTNIFFAGISGSAVADASAVGKAMIPAMAKQGYPSTFAAAVTASASVVGPIIPPSIPIIVYAIASGLPIGTLFLAGAGPGIFFGLVLMIITYGISRRHNYPRQPRAPLWEIIRSIPDVIWALIMPIIIVGGVVTGITTVTEAAAVAVFYALIVGAFVYRELTLRKIFRTLLDAAISSAVIMFIIAVASLFGWVLVRAGIHQILSSVLTNEALSVVAVLALINVALLIFGCVIEGNAAILIFAPLLLPTVTDLGVDPIHFGIIMVFNLMLGLITPPVGMSLFIVSEISRDSVFAVVNVIWPFLIAGLFTLIVITYWPPLTLFLPSILS